MLRTKLTIWYSILMTVVLVLVSAFRYAGERRLLEEQEEYSLKVVADILDSTIPREAPSTTTVQRAMARIARDYPDIEFKGLIIEVYDAGRTAVYSSSLAEVERLPLTDAMWRGALQQTTDLRTIEIHGDEAPIRILTKPVFDRKGLVYIIQVGRSTREIELSLDHFLLISLVVIPVAAVMVSLGGWLLTRRMLKPLERVMESAHQISSGELNRRVDVAGSSREIRELADAFNQMLERLEASFRQTREFGENVSHELRIPLSILKGETELGLRRARAPEEYRRILQSSLEEIERMQTIVDRLLFLSRADRGELSLKLAEFDLYDLAADVLPQFAVPAEAKQLRLTLEGERPFRVVGDELLLREVVMNLIQNAINHTPDGGAITVSLGREPGAVTIIVSDTGIGIPAEEIQHIFERFYQVDRSRSTSGSGLGLSICRWIVQAHHGRITVESIVGQGSRFVVSLPFSD